MKDVRHPADHRRSQRGGAVLGLVGICMIAFMAFAMLGVDIGRLAFTGTEAQALADAAATSGAHAYLTDPVGSATAQAQAVANLNTVDGTAATSGNTTTALTVTPGCWNTQTDSFNAAQAYPPACGQNEFQAVSASADATVNNIIAAMFQHPSSSVTRSAIAVAGGVSNGRPAFPVALSECWYKQYLSDRDCNTLDDQIQLVPGSPNSGCYTNLSAGDPANPNTYLQYLPAECASGGLSGQGVTPPLVDIGDDIQLQNGAVASALRVIEDCVQKGHDDWLVPVIKCTGSCTGVICNGLQCNQSSEVVGFAAIHVCPTCVKPTGGKGSSPAGITVQSICKDDVEGTGGGGGPDNGIKKVSMVQ